MTNVPLRGHLTSPLPVTSAAGLRRFGRSRHEAHVRHTKIAKPFALESLCYRSMHCGHVRLDLFRAYCLGFHYGPHMRLLFRSGFRRRGLHQDFKRNDGLVVLCVQDDFNRPCLASHLAREKNT